MDAVPQQLMLELEVGSDPVCGVLSGPGFRVRFEGWLGLISAVERARAGAPFAAPAAGAANAD